LEVKVLGLNFAISRPAWAFGSRVHIHNWCRYQSQLDEKTEVSFQLRPSAAATTHAPERVHGYVKVENGEEVLIPDILFDLCPRLCGQLELGFKFAGNLHLALTTENI
jgi:hypothetical protein